MIQSPLNYTGGKYKLLPQILPLFPKEINIFVDLFCGGCNVGINVTSNYVLFNDLDRNLISLLNTFKTLSLDSIKYIEGIIEAYSLSDSTRHTYEEYDCIGDKGLSPYNKESFMKLRNDFNSNLEDTSHYHWLQLYVLIVFAFNNQIRFNSKGEYNISVGKRDFNSRMREKFKAFVEKLSSISCSLSNLDFRKFDFSRLTSKDFVYVDPPYLLSCATYNELGGWTERDELDLLRFLEILNSYKIPFALSNVLRSKGKENTLLIEWSKNYKVIPLKFNYNNSSYHLKDKDSLTEEVLIVNY